MNEQSIQLAAKFREVILSGTWIANTNYKDQLESMDYKIATKSLGAHNTIAALAQHIHYYITGVKKVLEGGTLDIKDKFSFDFKPMASQQQWELFLHQFWKHAEEFAVLVENCPAEKLNQFFVDPKYGTYLRNIDGMIEHSYYHLGQIVLLKKFIQPKD